MAVDWEFLETSWRNREHWNKKDVDRIYKILSVINKIRQKDKTIDKIELLFFLSQNLMKKLWGQSKDGVENLLENSDEHFGPEREKELLDEIENLTRIINSKEEEDSTEIPYDWSKSWKLKKHEIESKLTSREHEIEQLVADSHNNEKEKHKLEQDIFELQSELSRSTSNLNALASEFLNLEQIYTKSQKALKDTEKNISTLKEENERLTSTNLKLEDKLKNSHLEINERVDHLNEILLEKEKEILNLSKKTNRSLDFQGDKKSPIKNQRKVEQQLHEVLQKKTKEITLLTEKLAEATHELDKNSEFFENIEKTEGLMKESEANQVLKLRKQLHEYELRIKRLEKQVTVAEDDAQQHAQDLATVLSELKAFMCGEYSLAEAVAELKEVRRQVVVRDSQIQELTAELNTMQINMNIFYEENAELREQLSLSDKEDFEIPVKGKREWKNSKDVLQSLTAEITNLKEEKTYLRAKVFELTREIADTKQNQPSEEQSPRISDNFVGLQRQINELQTLVINFTKSQDKGRQSSDQIQVQQCSIRAHQNLEEELTATKESLRRLKLENNSLEKIVASIKESSAEDWEKVENQKEKKEEEDEEEIDEHEVEFDNDILNRKMKKYQRILRQLPLSTQETMVKLKKQMQFLLEEITVIDSEADKCKIDSINYKKQFESMYEEISHLNNKLFSERDKWNEEIDELKMNNGQLEVKTEALVAQIQELKLFIEGMQCDRSEETLNLGLQRAEYKYEMVLNKRMLCLVEKDIGFKMEKIKELRDSNAEYQRQVKTLENALVKEKGKYNQVKKNFNEYLNNSVPITLHDITAAELAAITAKYRSLLNAKMLQKREKFEERKMNSVVDFAVKEKEEIQEKLIAEREKNLSLQTSLSLLHGCKMDSDSKIEILLKQKASAETRELMAKEKLMHINAMLETSQKEREEISFHLQEVEESNRELLESNLALQEQEIKLQAAIASNSSFQQRRLERELDEWKQSNIKMSGEIQRLEGLLVVSQTQLDHFKLRSEEAEIEIEETKKMQTDLATLNDDKTKLAILHMELTHEKLCHQKTKSELDQSRMDYSRAKMELAKATLNEEEKDNQYKTYMDYSNRKISLLLFVLKDMRVKFAGAVPLPQQERMNILIEDLLQEKKELTQNLTQSKSERRETKLLLEEMKVKMENIEEISRSLENSSFPSQIISVWNKKLEDVRLANVHLKEKLSIYEEEFPLLKAHLSVKEERCSTLQDQLNNLERFCVEQQISLADPELEIPLNSNISEASVNPPETNKAKQIEDHTISNYVLEAKDKQISELANLVTKLQTQLNLKEEERETRYVVQTKERKSLESTENSDTSSKESPALEVIINNLKERIKIGEVALDDCKSLLKKTKSELRDTTRQHQSSITTLNEENYQLERKVKSLKAEIRNYTEKYSNYQMSSEYTSDIKNLKDILTEKEKNLERLEDEKLALENKCKRYDLELSFLKRKHNEDRQETEMTCEIKLKQMQREIARMNEANENLIAEKEMMSNEFKKFQEHAIKSPSLILKTLVEKLRDQLIEKEKQISNMSRTLEDLEEKVSRNERESKVPAVDRPVRDDEHVYYCEEHDMKIQNLETLNASLELKLKSQKDIDEIRTELDNMTSKYNNLSSQKIKLEKDLRTSRKKAEEFKENLSVFQEKFKTESSELALKKMERQADIEKHLKEWEVKKKLENIIKTLKDKSTQLEDTLSDTRSKLSISKTLLEKSEKEKFHLRDKLAKLSKEASKNMCSICFKSCNTTKDLNKMYTTDCSEDEGPQTFVIEEDQQQEICLNCEKIREERDSLAKKVKELSHKISELKSIKSDLEKRFCNSVSEIKALNDHNERLNKHIKKFSQSGQTKEEYLIPGERRPVSALSGASLVLSYEAKIGSLEQSLREKARLLEQIKSILEESSLREEKLNKDKERLLKKICLLESVKEDTEESKLISELRKAKVTINRLQREIDRLQTNENDEENGSPTNSPS